MRQLLIVEDDIAFCKMLETFLKKKGFEVFTAFSGSEAIKKMAEHPLDLIITDVRLPDQDGLVILQKAKMDLENTPVILMTGYAEVNMAVTAMKEGAFDYISKPVRPDELLSLINKALDESKNPIEVAPSDNIIVKEEPSKISKPKKAKASGYVKGVSDTSGKLNQYIDLVAPTNMSVLIIGDSGTGKEYVAKNIHDKSKRKLQPFVAVDCGAIPKEIATSEFFGHIKGSFTGAVNDKIGHFEAANGGTIFLDEIGNLGYELQVQLLRALQERKIKPVGSNKEINVDIRVVAATNEDLEEAVKQGDFREDLYHRLNEFSIQVPRLSDRQEDLMLFANVFLDKANEELEKNITGFDDAAIAAMKSYDWPGNLRELKNTIKRAVLLTVADEIDLDVLPRELVLSKDQPNRNDYGLFKSKNEEEMILNALENSGGNKSKAARLLNIDRKTLYNKLKHYDIDL
ncbi:sigma-54-dependent transcriptional regulator [Flavimarina sp. Hel_I_48]|uniref:sigma-54-dependent transcriptional regulator n=1 Tax=Flavimarina sp. Hel_I_48 TaxID=1392488 RepID=UPI0004DF8A07|nr:sigma-54 dependent transcriptional regulator [Flavimarina sp. Hel_I_48]